MLSCMNKNIIAHVVIPVPAKGPNITSIVPTATSLKVTWNVLSANDSNGEITKYEVFLSTWFYRL